MTTRRIHGSSKKNKQEGSGRSVRSGSSEPGQVTNNPPEGQNHSPVGNCKNLPDKKHGTPSTDGSRTRKGRRFRRTTSSSSKSSVQSPSEQVKGSLTPRKVRSDGHEETSDFVDARSLTPDQAVSGRIGSDQDGNGMGVIVRPKVIDFQARVHEKRSASRRIILMRFGTVLLVLILVAALVWILGFSPVFRLHQGEVSVSGGNAWVADEKVADIIKEEGDRSLFLVSTGSIENDIRAMAGVTDAKVHKRFPHGLEVTFKAQEPTAILKDSKDQLIAVDRDGRELNTIDKAVQGIPIIQVKSLQEAQKDRVVKQTLQILSTMPEKMRHSVTKVTADTQDSITTELDRGEHVIIWGDSSDLKLKQAVVDKIINDPSKIGDKHQLDVSAPLRPIVK